LILILNIDIIVCISSLKYRYKKISIHIIIEKISINRDAALLESIIRWNQFAFVHFGSYGEAEKALNGIKSIQYKGN